MEAWYRFVLGPGGALLLVAVITGNLWLMLLQYKGSIRQRAEEAGQKTDDMLERVVDHLEDISTQLQKTNELLQQALEPEARLSRRPLEQLAETTITIAKPKG